MENNERGGGSTFENNNQGAKSQLKPLPKDQVAGEKNLKSVKSHSVLPAA